MQWSERVHVLCRSIFVLSCAAVVPVREKTQTGSLTHLMDGLRASDGASETRKPWTQQGLQTTALIKCAHRVQIVTC